MAKIRLRVCTLVIPPFQIVEQAVSVMSSACPLSRDISEAVPSSDEWFVEISTLQALRRSHVRQEPSSHIYQG
jgi:hypothetical protein